MAKFWINDERYDLSDWGVDFSDKETWNELIMALQEENTVMAGTKDLIEKGYIKVRENNTDIPKDQYFRMIDDRISDNNDTISFIKFALGG